MARSRVLASSLLQWVQKSVGALGRQNGSSRRYLYSVLAAATGGVLVYAVDGWRKQPNLQLLPVAHAHGTQGAEKGEDDSKGKKKSSEEAPPPYREARFKQFASVEHEGFVYMTPQDFLESVTERSPRPRIGRQKLSRQQLDSWHYHTPKLSKGSCRLFRNLHDKGIISFTEYLFLLCVLTKPHSGFRIAFNMFDTDGNQMVDKKEFLVLERMFSKDGPGRTGSVLSPQAEMDKDMADTTLMVHFFGPKGNQVLNYSHFHKFMSNLQKEVIELEFSEFSRGLSTISEVDFAKILLRYTNLDSKETEDCLHRVRSRIPQEKGISLEDFSQFCQFLNNLDDFALSMKMYTYAQKSVSQEDFQRAVKVCTGYTLGPHVVHTVFQIFDSDGDGHLSHQEFISIMKDRLHRGARSHLMHTQNSWDSFRTCIRNEMKSF